MRHLVSTEHRLALETFTIRTFTIPDQIKHVCVVHADLSRVAAEKQTDGLLPYYSKDFDIVLICGPELRAQVRWTENVRACDDGFHAHTTNIACDHQGVQKE